MHNLDRSIAEWRKDMSRTRGLGPDTLDELESHLRETIHALVESGTPERDAVQRAMEQLGPVGEVSAEFQKLSPATWLPVRIVRVLAGVLAVVMLSDFQHGFRDALLTTHIYLLLLGYVEVLLLGVLGICFVIQRSFAEFSTRRAEAIGRGVGRIAAWGCTFTILGVILGMVWSQRAWGRCWSWDPREIGGLCVVLWQAGFLAVQWFWRASARSMIVASLVGSSVVLLAVFGPQIFSRGVDMYGSPLFPGCTVLLVIAVNALFFFVGLAPAGWLRWRRGVVS
jgi:hypothetical protein